MDPSATLSPAYLAQDNSAPLLGTCISFLIIETIFMFLMYASRFLGTDSQANLWMTILMTGGYMICVAKISIGLLMIQIGGAGRHLVALPLTTVTSMLKLTTVLQIICPLTTSLTKLGILCLLNQILGRTSKHYRLVIKTTFSLVLAVLLIQVIIPFANCKPFSHTWQPFGPGHCAFSGLSLWRYLSIPNIVTTIMIVGIPVPTLYHLNVSAPTKLGLGLIFSVCMLGIVAAIMRFQSFLAVKNFDDITYETINPLCWTIAESGIYLVAGVMPTLRPLVRKVSGRVEFDKIISRTFRTSGSWGNKRGSKMLCGKPLPPVPEKGGPETSMTEYADMSGRNSRNEARETIFSAQEQSVIVMMERNSDMKGLM